MITFLIGLLSIIVYFALWVLTVELMDTNNVILGIICIVAAHANFVLCGYIITTL